MRDGLGFMVWYVGAFVLSLFVLGLYLAQPYLSNIFVGELDHKAIETAVVQLTNAERVSAGLDPLAYSERVSEVARTHSESMAKTGVYAHIVNGRDPSDRAGFAGFPCGFAENIHKLARSGFGDAEDMAEKLVKDWMASPAHKRNILDSNYRRIGVGVFVDDSVTEIWVYSTQNFSPC